MRNIYKILFGLLLFSVYQTPALARESVTDWYIKNLQTTIVVNADSSLDITENILADCGDLPGKHGIYRVLPKKYKTVSGTFNLPTNLVSITHNGIKANYSVDSTGDTSTYRIGDSDSTVQGENLYQIKYHVKNTIRTANINFDELYWNVLGSYWDLEIDNFTATIVFPSQITKDNAQISYYIGNLNSKSSDLAAYSWTSDNVLEIVGRHKFLRNQGVTFSISFPKNIIKPYQATFADKHGFSIFEILVSILVILASLFISSKLKIQFATNYKTRQVIVPEFEIPENLTPIEMGAIIKQGKLDKNSIAATIIHLGFLGYLKIERVEKKMLFFNSSDFKIINTNQPVAEDLNSLETYILSVILGTTQEVELSNIGLTISSHFTTITQKQLSFLNSKNYIDKKIKKYKSVIFGVTIYTFLTFLFLAFKLHSLFLGSLGVASGVILIFSLSLKLLTVKGEEISSRLKGFKLYMETAEKYRSEYQEKNDILDKLLPYAVLFGITSEWLSKIKDIYGEEYLSNYSPSFIGGNLGLIGFNNFISTISTVSNSISNGVASAISNNTSGSSSGFGGSGSSGGGGGGGGGGGW